ncbi:MAG: hypothetical protein KGL39_02505 [Patescibacteria group bacterium]|nr:hypothetical protein [Patescibacteria group bacterium]
MPTIIDSITLMGLSAADVRLVHCRRRIAVLFLSLHMLRFRGDRLHFSLFFVFIFIVLLSIHEAVKHCLAASTLLMQTILNLVYFSEGRKIT